MGATTGPGRRRQARAEQTRQRLLAAAQAAFAEHGHDGVNLKVHVLEPAGVSVGSFYHQFSDKTDLLVTLLDEAVDAWRATVVGDEVVVAGEGLEETVRAVLTRFLAGVEAGEELWRIHLRERENPEPRIQARIRRGRAAWRRGMGDRLRPALDASASDADVDRAARLLAVMCIGLATAYLDEPRSRRTAAARRALVDDATTFATGGIPHLTSGSDQA